MKQFKLFFACVLMSLFSLGQVWATVESGITYAVKSAAPTGWSTDGEFATSGGGFIKLVANTNYIQTDEFCQNGFTSIKIKARKFGGPDATQGVISVEWFENGGSSTVLATVSPTSTSLADYTLSELESVTGNKSGYIKISCKEASGGKGCGVSQVTITYTAGSCGGGTPTCATPTFSPAAGSYEGTQNVTITSTTGATIYYTTDGTTPSTTSSVYSTPIAVAADMTIKAYAVKSEYNDSEVAEAAYTITEGPDVVLDLTDNAEWGFPAGSGNKTVDEGSYSDGTYTIKVAGSTGQGYYHNTGYLLLGKTGAYIELPEFASPIEKIITVGTSGGSEGVTFNVFDGSTAVSTEATGCKNVDQTFNIENPEANKVYTIKVTGNANLQVAKIKIYFGAAAAVAKPTISGDENFVTSTTVTLACSTTGADIYYTTDGSDPKSGTIGTSFSLTETATVRAIAKLGSDWSAEATKTFTKIEALTTMDQIFAKATAVGTTATDVSVTFNNWVVTGVKNSNAYVTDGTKGFIIYASGHGFAVGNVLSGTAACKVQLYNGSSELTNLTSTTDGLTVTTGGTASVNVLDDAGIADLSGVKTGSLIKISGECTEEGGKFKIGGVQLYNSLYSFSVSAGTSYNVTGVYVQYNSTKEIMPRNADDIEVSSSVAVTDIDLTESTASVEVGETVTLHASVVPGTATDKAIVWTVESGSDKASVSNGVVTGLAAGTAVIRAAAHENASLYAECTVTVTAADPTKHKVTFDATVDKTADESDVTLTKSNVTIAMTEGTGRFNNGTDYRPWKSSVFTVSCSAGNITKIEFTCTSSKPISGFENPEVGNLEKDGNNGVWTGNAASVSFTASNAQVQITTLTITYQEDSRAEAGLAWDPSDDIELTVGDAFTAPTLLNPNSIDAAEITIESSNPSVATVTAGVVALVADATGTTTITATFAGNASYKPATISYDITVNAAAPILTDYYEKVTSTANIVEGTYLIVYEEGNLAFDGGLATLDAVSNTIAVAITTDDKIGVTPATEAATFYIDPAAGTIKSASDHYIGVSSWSNGLKQTDTYVHNVLEIDGDGNAQIGIYNAEWNTTGGTMLLQYNKSVGQTRFRYYKNGGQQPIALYKLHDEVIKPAAGLAWDPSDDIEITVGDAFTAPTLLNPNSIDAAEITIESSNPSVATVTAGVVELVADATGTTTITATFAGNASYKPATVSYKIKVNPASSIYVSPSLTVNFGSVEKDAALPDDKTITVTLNNVAAATATLGGTNPEAFSIDPATLTASGDITISVVSTATAGSYSATLTISDDASVAASKVVNLSLTVTDPATEEAAISTTSKWVAATNANLVDGAEVLITGVKSDVTYAISEQGSNNRTTDAGSLSEGVFTPGSNTMSFVLEEQATGKYALRTSNGKYLYAASSSANHLKTRDAIGDDGKAVWSISINVDNEASIVANCETANWRNVMQFNQNGGNPPIVACYASASQSVIKLYVPQAVTPTPDYTRTEMLGAGVLGTICVDHNVTSAEGATFYEVSGLNGSQLVLAEVTGELEAGKPYVFQATGNVLNLYYGTTSVADPVNTGALKGTFSATTIENTDPNWANIYYFANHALYSCSDLTSLTLPANRAYLVMSQVGGFSPMPGRRYFTVNVNGKTTPTGMEEITNDQSQMTNKVIIDGCLYILRGEKLYDATGRLVK